jgi:hypothetical protein
MFACSPGHPRNLRRLGVMLCLALLGILPVSLRAQLLWPGTGSGMSVEEVQRAFPTAHAPATPAELVNDRGVQWLELDQTVIAEHPFRVLFYFKDRLLVQVALVDAGEIPVKEFEKFRELLRGKYGMEYSTRSSEYIQVTWKAVQTTILLTWTPQGHGIAILSISYEAPILKETNRL